MYANIIENTNMNWPMKRIAFCTGTILGLSACASSVTSDGYLRELPEEVVELAAPNQDLTAVTLLEEDGCYWYRHQNAVEVTLLPLLTKNGRPICTRAQS